MSFSAEMKEFISAFQVGTKTYDEKSENDLRKLSGELYKERAESERHDRKMAEERLKLQGDKFAASRRKALDIDNDREKFIGDYEKRVREGSAIDLPAAPDQEVKPVTSDVSDDEEEDPGYAAGGAVVAGEGDSTGPGTPFSAPGPGPNDNRPNPGNVAQGMETAGRLDNRYDSYEAKPLKMGPNTPGPDYDQLKDKYTDQLRDATQNVRDRIRRHNQARRDRNMERREENEERPLQGIPTMPGAAPTVPGGYMGYNEGNNTGDGHDSSVGDNEPMHLADGGKVEEQGQEDGLPTRDELREYVRMGLDAIEEDIKMDPRAQDGYLTGEVPNAPTDQEIAAIDRMIGLDEGDEPQGMASGGVVSPQGKSAIADYEKAELRLGAMVSWYLQKGDHRKARDAAKNLLAYHQSQTSRYSALAMTALQNGDKVAAAKYANKAAGNVLNGQLQVIRPLPDGTFEYQSIDPHTKKVVERQRATPQQVGGVLQNSLAGGIPLQSLMSFVGQKPAMRQPAAPRLTEKERAASQADEKVGTIKRGMRAIGDDAKDDMFDTSGVRTTSTALPAVGGFMSEVQDTREQNSRMQRRGALEIGDVRYKSAPENKQSDNWNERRGGYDEALDAVWNEGAPDKSGKATPPPAPGVAQRQVLRAGINAVLQRNKDLDPQDAARLVTALDQGVEPRQHEDGRWQVGNVKAFVPAELIDEARGRSRDAGSRIQQGEKERASRQAIEASKPSYASGFDEVKDIATAPAGAIKEMGREASKPSYASGFDDIKDIATAPAGAIKEMGREAINLGSEVISGQSRPERETNDPEGWVGWGQ